MVWLPEVWKVTVMVMLIGIGRFYVVCLPG